MKRFLDGKIITIENFLSKEECKKYIKEIDEKNDKTCFTSFGIFENDKYIDEDLALYFFNKVKNCNITGLDIIKPNNLIFTSKYLGGEQFGLHTDTGLYFDKKNREKTRYTLLIYLNDDFSGGETAFYNEKFIHQLDIKPKMGKALIFDIDLWHKGKEVSGKKYWIGCELVGKF